MMTSRERYKKWFDKMSPEERRLFYVRHTILCRCYRKKQNDYPRYGGRGIRVCNEWRHSWRAFLDWALSHGYRQGLQIDRIDNNGDYCPENCHFVTPKENARNKRNNRRITFRGETHLLCEWSERTGLTKHLIYYRINVGGWSVERALTTPVDKKKSHRHRIEKEFEKSKNNNNQNTNEK